MVEFRRLAFVAGVFSATLSSFACSAGGSGSDGAGARYPDATSEDAGRVRNRDASADAGEEDVEQMATDGGVTHGYNYYVDIAPILEARCSGDGLCHTDPPAFGAPRALVRYSDLVDVNRFGQKVHELVAYRIVATVGHMPPQTNTQLTASEIEKILSWSADGAPPGPEPADSGVAPDARPPDGGIPLPWADGGASPDPGPGLRYVEIFAHAQDDYLSPYVAQRAADGTSYYCFGFTVPPNPDPNAMPESVIEFDAFVDAYRNVHHLFAYAVDSSNTAPDGPVDCITGGVGRIIGSWFPGRGNTYLPEGVGVPLRAGQRLNLQVHYDSVPNAGVPDMSGLRLVLTEQQNLIQAGEVWAGIDWMTQMGPGDVTLQSVTTNTFDDVHIYSVTPHMHAKGLRLSLEYRLAADPPGTWHLLNNTDPWDFTNQISLNIEPPLVLNPGDQMRTTCTWSTATGPIIQGQSSQNEMCYYYLGHYRYLGANPPLLSFYYFVAYP